ncbi:hypothetical protein E2C01_040138 [Portunus trituberculatus]|uniref:Uncharacterized protein n=1 Tax=Portunus trituberculatus TaxID=210409 RepID=A0A5B7FM60_PORTR|nr:hypothetical protein [Portunus trituberculatus]
MSRGLSHSLTAPQPFSPTDWQIVTGPDRQEIKRQGLEVSSTHPILSHPIPSRLVQSRPGPPPGLPISPILSISPRLQPFALSIASDTWHHQALLFLLRYAQRAERKEDAATFLDFPMVPRPPS